MRAYLSIVKLRFYLLLQYRVAALTGVSAQVFFGFVRVMVFFTLYHYTTGTQPLSYAQALTYTWLGQVYVSILPWGGIPEVDTMIRSGNVAYELCRPVDLYNRWFSSALAFRMAPTLMRGVPVFAVALLLLPGQYAMQPPVSVAAIAAWLAATMGAVLLSSAITTLASIVTLWTISGVGVARLIPAVVNIFSGVLLPLPFYPTWLQGLIGFLPFRGLVDTPIRFYLGQAGVAGLAPFLGHQLLWTLVFVLVSRWLLHYKLRELVVQGG